MRVLALLAAGRGSAQRAEALDVGDEQLLAVGGDEHGAGIPAGRDQARAAGSARGRSPCRASDDLAPRRTTAMQLLVPLATYSVLAVGAQGQGVAAAAEGQPALGPAGDRLDDLVGVRVDDRDGVAVGVGDVDESPVAGWRPCRWGAGRPGSS